MKLLRYGLIGQEKPGLLDADGTIRDLSEHVFDIDGAALDPDTLARIWPRSTRRRCRRSNSPSGLAPASAISASSCASGSIIPTTQPNRSADPRTSDPVHEGQFGDRRPE
jgi:hypothetical protein